MKKVFLGFTIVMYALMGGLLTAEAFAGVSEKSFSIVYSSDERGAITPCG
ncbi:MAG: hypothetical protein J7M09_00970 [Deltaproteobacteria bacterium]|nr:hypothetical protein [Candidatus Tharpella sp.]